MEQVDSFLEMGGYGGFVWPAFAVTAAVLVGLLAATLRRLRAVQADLARLQATDGTPQHGARR